MVKTTENHKALPRTPGLVLHAAAYYDLLVWLFTFGRERAFREKMLRLARLRAGEVVLDVGCGTGTLAVLAARQVGPSGATYGIDASPEMIATASRKAARQGVPVTFDVGSAQALPFADGTFDVVLTTLLLHHLPRPSRQRLAREMRRVLKPGGRVLVIDFGEGDHAEKSLLSHFHRPHGHTKLQDTLTQLKEAGFAITNSGAVGMKSLQYVCATSASGALQVSKTADETHDPAGKRADFDRNDTHNSVGPNLGRHMLGSAIVVAVIVAVFLHAGVAAALWTSGVGALPTTGLALLGLAGLILLIVGLKGWYFLSSHFKRHGDLENRP